MKDILDYDANFSEAKFKTYVDNVFIQLHLAFMTKDLEKIKHFVSKEVYKYFLEKLELLNKQKATQMYDEINVKQTSLLSSEVLDDKMLINVHITSRYMDYLIDESGALLSGNNSSRVEKENYLTFERKNDYQIQNQARKCSGCGANIDVNASGKCKYCGTIYNLEDKDWILVKFEVR